MSAIVKLTPDPVWSAIVEIRIESSIAYQDALKFFYPLFNERFPNLTERHIPPEIKNNKEFKFTANYILKNDNYALIFDNNVIAFEKIADGQEYQTWKNFFPLIIECLNVIGKKDIVKSIIRVGVRYQSVLEGYKSIGEVLNYRTPIDVIDVDHFTEKYTFVTKKGEMQVSTKLVDLKGAKEHETGVLVDIDVSQVNDLPQSIGSGLIEVIDKLHSEEKRVFFGLVRQGELPKYSPQIE